MCSLRRPGTDSGVDELLTPATPTVAVTVTVPAPRPWLAATTLGWREIVRFFRQRNRVIGAIGQPLLFWLLFGAGLHQTFVLPGAREESHSFQQYYLPGTIVLILLFTAIFASISIIEDRREGFLQSVLVAPIPRWSMVLGKVLGGSLIALFQGLIFLVLALTIHVELSWGRLGALVALLFVGAVGMNALGFVMAWRMDSTQGFHAIMSLVLMPMWLLSGSFFPVPVLSAQAGWPEVGMHWGMRLNPLTYLVAGVRRLLFEDSMLEALQLPATSTCWLVSGLFTCVLLAAAWKMAGGRTTGDLL